MEKETKKGKKILKIVLIIVAILIAVLFIHTIRNYVIITNLQSKLSNYEKNTNYHIYSVSEQENGMKMEINYYTKNDKEVMFLERTLNNDTVKMSVYNNGQRKDMFVETKDTKTVQLNVEPILNVKINNILETDNNMQTLIGSFACKINTTNYNNKKCYVISNFMGSGLLNGTEKEEMYIEKDTGLYVKSIMDNERMERQYEFDNVDDSIFIEPDISQYTIKENS